MKHENVINLDLSTNPIQSRNQEKSENLNLPDLDFFLWCQQQYKINKGVYNTIDRWFYKNGFMKYYSSSSLSFSLFGVCYRREFEE